MNVRLGNINLFVRDVQKARDFYVQGLGLVEDAERSHSPGFVLLRAGECTITLQDATAPGASFTPTESVELGFEVDDTTLVREKLEKAGAKVSAPQQMGWGSGFDAFDLDGHRLTVYRMNE